MKNKRPQILSKASISEPAEDLLQELVEGWQELKFYGDKKILPRKNSAGCIYKDSFYLYGGYSNSNGVLEQFWRLDLWAKHFQWDIVPQKGKGPGPKSGHSCSLMGDELILFGGQGREGQSSNQLFKYNFISQTWLELESKGQFPIPLDSHCAVITKDFLLVFFGFCTQREQFNQTMYKYNFQTQVWSEQKGGDSLPPPRSNSACCLVDNKVFVFGGDNLKQRMNDLWELDLIKMCWRQVQQKETIPERRGHSLCSYGNRLILFGGYHELTWQLNDIRGFDFVTGTWKVLDYSCGLRSPQRKSQNSTNRKGRLLSTGGRPQIRSGGVLRADTTGQYSPNKIIQQKRMKQIVERKKELLARLSLQKFDQKELMNRTPCSQGLLDSIAVIGEQTKRTTRFQAVAGFEMALPTNVRSKFDLPLQRINNFQEGKKPCARDGQVGLVSGSMLYIFGGDRHKMNFSDLHRFDLLKSKY